MSYLVDTNIISEVRKAKRCDGRVAAWWASVDERDVFISVLVLGEIRKGIERARATDRAQADALDAWLASLVERFSEHILPIDRAAADAWGRMSARRPVSTIDALLAASALTQSMTLVTRNVADVADLGVDVVNPFEFCG